MTSVDEVLERARSALGRSTLYWLGEGGQDPRAPLPSSRLAAGRIWPTLPREQRMELEPLAKAQGIDVHDPGLVLDACDCSGYVCWALGIARRVDPDVFPGSGGWINTDSIWADAMGPGTKFERLSAARPGALLVYPKDGSPDPYGHIGIVMEADASGHATLVAHCSAANVMAAPFDAIKITSPEPFRRSERTIHAWFRG
jgi:hypothetical protein